MSFHTVIFCPIKCKRFRTEGDGSVWKLAMFVRCYVHMGSPYTREQGEEKSLYGPLVGGAGQQEALEQGHGVQRWLRLALAALAPRGRRRRCAHNPHLSLRSTMGVRVLTLTSSSRRRRAATQRLGRCHRAPPAGRRGRRVLLLPRRRLLARRPGRCRGRPALRLRGGADPPRLRAVAVRARRAVRVVHRRRAADERAELDEGHNDIRPHPIFVYGGSP